MPLGAFMIGNKRDILYCRWLIAYSYKGMGMRRLIGIADLRESLAIAVFAL